MVGVRGFEPPASASRTQRSSQTEPHPDLYVKSNILQVMFFSSPSKFVKVLIDG